MMKQKCPRFLVLSWSINFIFIFFSVDIVIFSSLSFVFISFRCLFNIAIARNEIVKFVKIHSHTNLKLTNSNLHHSPKQHDEHLLNSHSSKKKKKLSSGTGSALSNTGGQEKVTGTMFSGRSGPQVWIEKNFLRIEWLRHSFRDLHRWISVSMNTAIELRKNSVFCNNSVKGKERNDEIPVGEILVLLVWNLIVKN